MRDLNQTRTTNIDQEAAALLARNRRRIRKHRAIRGELTTHLAPDPDDDVRQAACGQASPYGLTAARDPDLVTCRRCLVIVRRGGPRPKGDGSDGG